MPGRLEGFVVNTVYTEPIAFLQAKEHGQVKCIFCKQWFLSTSSARRHALKKHDGETVPTR